MPQEPGRAGLYGGASGSFAGALEFASLDLTMLLRPLTLCWLLVLVGAGPLVAQSGASRVLPVPADAGPASSESLYHLWPEERPDRGRAVASCSPYRLLAGGSADCDRRVALADPTAMDAPHRFDQPETEVPRWSFLEDHRLLFSTLIPVTAIGAVTANSLVAYNTNHSFRVHREGWFGRNTVNGGADKASHLTDYYVVASLFEDAYKMIGYSEKQAILMGLGLAVATGLANEVSDGFTRHGFAWEDLAMDSAGAVAASVVSATRTRDLFGLRTSHLPSSTYNDDVYSADFKLAGLGERLGVNLGPLRWLLFSVTYGTKGYRETSGIEPQRQLGFEIGLNLQQVLFDLKVSRGTWWGYALHVVGDNVRFPFTAIGMRVDLNRGKWHGPNSGNYD